MGGKGFEGLRATSLKAAAAETAELVTRRRQRLEAIREVVEGSGANYMKAVVYSRGHGKDGVEIMVPTHVLLYMFEPGEVGEQVAHAWLLEASRVHGAVRLKTSVYAACTGPLAALPVVGAPMREKTPKQVRQVEAGTYESERAKMGRAVEAA